MSSPADKDGALDRSAGVSGTDWRRPCGAAAVAALGVILALTLVPVGGPAPSGFQWRLFAEEVDLSDFICNVVLFVPLAIALRCSGVSAWKTVALGLLLSATIEFAQLRVVSGRDASFSDLLSNTLGAVAGVALVRWFPTRRRSALRGVAAAALSLAVIATTGFLQHPSFPPTPYYGQWTADLGQHPGARPRPDADPPPSPRAGCLSSPFRFRPAPTSGSGAPRRARRAPPGARRPLQP